MTRGIFIFLLLAGSSFAQNLVNVASRTFPDAPSARIGESPTSGFVEGYSSTRERLPDRERFLNKKNLVLIGSFTVLQGLDAYRTERALNDGAVEQFPIARHFCQTRGSRIAYFGLNYAGTVGMSYWLHRKGHPQLARLFTVMSSVSAATALSYTISHAH
jgi:hypothetical protein